MAIFNWNLRIGHLYRTGQHHQLAQQAWIDHINWAEGREAEIVAYWQCVLDAEIPWLQEEVSYDDFLTALDLCLYEAPLNKTNLRNAHHRQIPPMMAGKPGVLATPNPSTDNVAVFSSGDVKIKHLRLTDVHGKTLLQATVDDYSYTLQTAQLQAAVYFIHCVCDDGNTYPIKWVKQ